MKGYWTLLDILNPLRSEIHVVSVHVNPTEHNRNLIRTWRILSYFGGKPEFWSKNIIYHIIRPFGNRKYVGETKDTAFFRYKSHLCEARTKNNDDLDLFHRTLREEGWVHYVTIPIIGLNEVEKAVRKFVELQVIKNTQPQLNSIGKKSRPFEKPKSGWGEACFTVRSGKSRVTRPLMKWRKRNMGSQVINTLNPMTCCSLIPGGLKMVSEIVQLSRRPFNGNERRRFLYFQNKRPKTLKNIQDIAEKCLEFKEHQIFWRNWVSILGEERIVNRFETNHRIKIFGGFDRDIQNFVKNKTHQFVKRCGEEVGREVEVGVTIFTDKGQSAYDILRNDHTWGRKPTAAFK